jgi:hypothetical protein
MLSLPVLVAAVVQSVQEQAVLVVTVGRRVLAGFPFLVAAVAEVLVVIRVLVALVGIR